MKPDRQRIKIAEACGYRCVQSHSFHGTPPLRDIRYYSELIPDYTGDLNAMHEAEKFLKNVNQLVAYLDELDRVCVPVHVCPTTHSASVIMATASQRAEAFLRTLRLWEDES